MVMIFFDTSWTASCIPPNATFRSTKEGYFLIMLALMHYALNIKILITFTLYFILFILTFNNLYQAKVMKKVSIS
jgi:hypothetical protein